MADVNQATQRPAYVEAREKERLWHKRYLEGYCECSINSRWMIDAFALAIYEHKVLVKRCEFCAAHSVDDI